MQHKGEFEKALKAIDLEIQNNSGSVNAWGTKATLLLKMAELSDPAEPQHGQYLQDAIKSATVGLQQDGNEVRLWDILATSYIHLANQMTEEKANLDKALYAIDQALSVDNKIAGFWLVKGFVHDRLDDIDQARQAFDRATLLRSELLDELPDRYKAEYGK